MPAFCPEPSEQKARLSHRTFVCVALLTNPALNRPYSYKDVEKLKMLSRRPVKETRVLE
jgi:hypothetical protein